MSKRNNRRGPRTTYYPTRNQTSKKLFHSPQAYGELIKIPMTPAMQAISVISLIIQAALTAFTMCKENDLPIVVFDMDTPGNLCKIVDGEPIGTVVKNA